MDIRRVRDVSDVAVAELVAKSDEYLSALYPPESNHAEATESLIDEDSAFFAGYVDGRIAACGGVKFLEDDVRYGEIKRVFVDEQYRGMRLAVTMMNHLEAFLSESGIHVVRLEAGPLQPEALSLYKKLGYSERGPFGDYRLDPLSIFMEKTLPGS